MKQKILLVFGVLAAILLIFNSVKKIMFFRNNAQQIKEAETRLFSLKKENEQLKSELEYKKSNDFAEEEIRNKLGLAKQNEAIVVLPKEEAKETDKDLSNVTPNWRKWWRLFFET
ncbi:septum formation initiator family protein [Candidatus Curtissbacteria bacterium]|nr:septum formation initiator family protein [Candidatus Curtissbacteria bacterium]